MPREAGPHVSDEALIAMLEGAPEGHVRRSRRHAERCATCTERLSELRRVELLLRDVAATEPMPERDLAFGALRRLRRRQTAITNVNEFLGALFAIVRGLGSLLAADEKERRETRSRGSGTGDRHG